MILDRQRYLVGAQITEADWRLFCTLIRFDAVYYSHFKCNWRHISEYPNLWQTIVRDLYQVPGVAETVSIAEIKRHYYHQPAEGEPDRHRAGGPATRFCRAARPGKVWVTDFRSRCDVPNKIAGHQARRLNLSVGTAPAALFIFSRFRTANRFPLRLETLYAPISFFFSRYSSRLISPLA